MYSLFIITVEKWFSTRPKLHFSVNYTTMDILEIDILTKLMHSEVFPEIREKKLKEH